MYFETIAGDNELVIQQENKSNNDEDNSYFLALKLHEEFNGNSFESNNKHLKIIDERWELIDPTPDIHQLFNQFNREFFYEQLSSVFVEWSQRMTRLIHNRNLLSLSLFYSCAGICIYESNGNFCRIALSEPLLKLRPRKDLVQALLVRLLFLFSYFSMINSSSTK
jgi:hypothetical protein